MEQEADMTMAVSAGPERQSIIFATVDLKLSF